MACQYYSDKQLNVLPSMFGGYFLHLIYFFDWIWLRRHTTFLDNLLNLQTSLDLVFQNNSPKRPDSTKRESVSPDISSNAQFTSALNKLITEFGYDPEKAKKALLLTDGHLENALNLLLDDNNL